MGKIAVAVVLLLLYCAYNAQICKVAVLKMPLKHNSTFERVAFVNLTNPDAPRIMYDLRACLAHCDSIDYPAFSATGFENAGPERLSLEDTQGVEDKYLGLFVKMTNMPVLDECYPSRDSFQEFLKSYQRTSTTSKPTTGVATTVSNPATSLNTSAANTRTTVPARISESSSSTTAASTTSRAAETTAAISPSPMSSTMSNTHSSTSSPSTTSTTSSSSTTNQTKTSTTTEAARTNATVKSVTEEEKSTDSTTMPTMSPTSAATTTLKPTTVTPTTSLSASTTPDKNLRGHCGVKVDGMEGFFELTEGQVVNATQLSTRVNGGSFEQPTNKSDIITVSLTSPVSLLNCGFNVTLSNGSATTWMGKENAANEQEEGWKDVIELACVCNVTTPPASTSPSGNTEPTFADSTTTAEPTTLSSAKPGTVTSTTAGSITSSSPSKPTSTQLIPETTTKKMNYSYAGGYIASDRKEFEVPTFPNMTQKYNNDEFGWDRYHMIIFPGCSFNVFTSANEVKKFGNPSKVVASVHKMNDRVKDATADCGEVTTIPNLERIDNKGW